MMRGGTGKKSLKRGVYGVTWVSGGCHASVVPAMPDVQYSQQTVLNAYTIDFNTFNAPYVISDHLPSAFP